MTRMSDPHLLKARWVLEMKSCSILEKTTYTPRNGDLATGCNLRGHVVNASIRFDVQMFATCSF